MTKRLMFFLILGAHALSTSDLWACSVCFGNPNSSMTKAAKAGVIFLLAVTGGVLGGLGWTFWTWSKRSRQLAASSDLSVLENT